MGTKFCYNKYSYFSTCLKDKTHFLVSILHILTGISEITVIWFLTSGSAILKALLRQILIAK